MAALGLGSLFSGEHLTGLDAPMLGVAAWRARDRDILQPAGHLLGEQHPHLVA